MLTVGSLFSGIGGFDLGLERAGMRVIWQSEIDPYASAVLRKHWPHVPNHGDIRTITAGSVERPDVLCGGFPCQPFSSAGIRTGKNDDRYLWPEMLRVIEELRPTWVCCENVTHLDRVALEDCIVGMEACGYEVAPPLEIPACAVGLDHWRPRLWILSYANSDSKSGLPVDAEVAWNTPLSANPSRHGRKLARGRDASGDRRSWQSVSRNADGFAEDNAERMGSDDVLPGRMDRLRCLGNAIVPQIAEMIGRSIIAAELEKSSSPLQNTLDYDQQDQTLADTTLYRGSLPTNGTDSK